MDCRREAEEARTNTSEARRRSGIPRWRPTGCCGRSAPEQRCVPPLSRRRCSSASGSAPSASKTARRLLPCSIESGRGRRGLPWRGASAARRGRGDQPRSRGAGRVRRAHLRCRGRDILGTRTPPRHPRHPGLRLKARLTLHRRALVIGGLLAIGGTVMRTPRIACGSGTSRRTSSPSFT